MTIIETLKNWADVELNLIDEKPDLKDYSNSMIVRWFFFGSCDICAQAMDLDDDEFQYFLKTLLKHIGISEEDTDELITKWMLDKMNDDELFIINQGALGFRAFETNPNGVGNLKQCLADFDGKFHSENKS
ncbi:MAG: hypothetical protein CBD21_02625 [bacterium TMED161]|nr:MAG: hypothetical protein CBD21_02625 [bacterium TMED161]|tara:strand:- start:4722 stop:5114 length:393 start_codon:yes stop_codon:yes gene_type:complete